MNFGSPDQHQLDDLLSVTRRGQAALTRACQATCLRVRISQRFKIPALLCARPLALLWFRCERPDWGFAERRSGT